jgi:hypothetical protein
MTQAVRTPRVLGFFYRTDPATDSREPWRFEVVDVDGDDDVVDVERVLAARHDVNVLGQLLDLEALDAPEREELLAAAAEGDEVALARILPGVPRVTTPGVDLDFDNAPDAEALRAQFSSYWRRVAGVELRWSRSSGPARSRLHGELGPAEPGAEHPELMRAAFGWWRLACRAIGLVERADHPGAGDFWVHPDDPKGLRGTVDLSPLNRAPERRGSLFRPLGGLTKDGKARKVLASGSVERGSPWTRELVEEGLRLWRAQEDAAGRSSARRRGPRPKAPLEDLPTCNELPGLSAWVRAVAGPGRNHELRLALSGVLVRSGLVRDHHGIEALARGTGNRVDSRDAWLSTKDRIRAGLPVKGAPSLRRLVGVAELERLAWSLFQDLTVRGTRVDYLEVMRRLNVLVPPEVRHVEHALAAVEARLAMGPDGRELKVLEQLDARLRALGRCSRRARQTEPCGCCGKLGCPNVLRCSVQDACATCARRYAQGYAESLELPARVDVALAFYESRKEAKKAVARVQRRVETDARPLGFTAPADGGRWAALVIGPTGALAGDVVRFVIPEQGQADAVHVTGQAPALGRAWVARILLARHVQARARLERGDTAGFVDLALELYRRKAVQVPRVAAIAWPSVEAVRGVRRAWAQKRQELPEEAFCGCPADVAPPHAKRWRVIDMETGRGLLFDLPRAPTLVRAVALEDGHAVLPSGASRRRRL